jgi:hypothetical protein
MSQRRPLTLLAICAAALFASGCSMTIDTGSDTAYKLVRKGNFYDAMIAGKLADVHKAVEAGFKDLGLDVFASGDGSGSMFEGKFFDQKDFTVTLTQTAPDVVRMRIRVGMKGNKARSRQLFISFERHFPKARFGL